MLNFVFRRVGNWNDRRAYIYILARTVMELSLVLCSNKDNSTLVVIVCRAGMSIQRSL